WVGLRTGAVVTIEWSGWHIVIKLGPVGGELRLKSVEDFLGQSARIFLRLYHERWHRTDDRRFCYSVFAVARQVVHHFTAARRMPDMERFLEVEMLCQRGKIICIMVHIVARARLSRPTMTSTVMSDHAITFVNEEKHLRVPVVS